MLPSISKKEDSGLIMKVAIAVRPLTMQQHERNERKPPLLLLQYCLRPLQESWFYATRSHRNHYKYILFYFKNMYCILQMSFKSLLLCWDWHNWLSPGERLFWKKRAISLQSLPWWSIYFSNENTSPVDFFYSKNINQQHNTLLPS